MITDNYSQQIYSENDLVDIFLTNTQARLKDVLVSDTITFNNDLNLEYKPNLIAYKESNLSIEEFDENNRNNWYMPESYKTLDIAKFVLDQCKNDQELQRAGEELLMYQERDMFMLLKYLKYLVDTMRKHNIVWGVGRGSSVSSFVLYLIGVHRINSLYYDLSINEFLK